MYLIRNFVLNILCVFCLAVGKPIVENCIAGYNSCVIAYGQTGSGKTYTMFGDVPEIASQQRD